MPAEQPVFGEGTTFEVNDGVANAFAPIVGLTAIEPPDEEYPRISRKILSSTTMIKKALGVPDAGDCSFEYEQTDVEYARVRALKNVVGVNEKTFRVTYTDGLRLSFKGVIFANKAGKANSGNEIVSAKAMLVVTSLITVSDTIP
jgi:hypothetical protein